MTIGLPDVASVEAASWVEPDNDRTVVIDASTAFRVADGWDYGFPGKQCHNHSSLNLTGYTISHTFCSFPELCKDQKDKLARSKRIANPGCYPTGFISLTRPLVDAGILKEGLPLTVNAISGYSGGGKGLMNIFENEEHEPWAAYGLNMVSIGRKSGARKRSFLC